MIYRIDVKTSTVNFALADDSTTPGEGRGVNGLEVRGDYLFWTSNGASVFVRVSINNDGLPTGPTEVVLKHFPSDDLTFYGHGDVYLVYDTTAVAVFREGSSKAEEAASGITSLILPSFLGGYRLIVISFTFLLEVMFPSRMSWIIFSSMQKDSGDNLSGPERATARDRLCP